MQIPRIICPSPSLFSPEGLDYAKEKLNICIAEMNQAEFESAAVKYDGALVRFDKKFTSEFMRQSKLKYIICPTTGLTHIDLIASEKLNVEIISLKGEYDFLSSIVATAEHTLTLLMALNRNLLAASNDTSAFNWRPSLHRGREVFGSKVGIIGMGRLGKIIAGYLSALGAQIYFYDPHVNSVDRRYVKLENLAELTDICNIISVHVDIRPGNYKFLDERFFSQINQLDVFINTSRGELLDEDSLLVAFDEGRIKKIGLDVLDSELDSTLSSNNILARAAVCNDIIVTPHIGGATFESISRTDVFIVDKFLKFIRS